MESKLNNLPPVSDFDSAYMLAQQAHENGFRGSTFLELWIWIKQRLDLIGLDNTAGLPEEFPTSGSTLAADSKGQWTVLTPGTYNKMTSGTIVVDENQFAFAQYDGVDYNNVRFVNLPDNSASVPNWEEGIYEKDKIVTVDGIIYRALEPTNEEPPSDKWEVIGGSEVDLELDKETKTNPTLVTISGSRWISGETSNVGSGRPQVIPGIFNSGKLFVKRGLSVRGKVAASLTERAYLFLYGRDGTYEYYCFNVNEPADFKFTATKDMYVVASSIQGDFNIVIEAETGEFGGLVNVIDKYSVTPGRMVNEANGIVVNSSSWSTSDYFIVSNGGRIVGQTATVDSAPILFKYNTDRSYVGAVSSGRAIDYISDGDYLYRVSVLADRSDELSVKVYEDGEVLQKVISRDSKNGFVNKGFSHSTDNGNLGHSPTLDTTDKILLRKGDKIEAKTYHNGSGTVRVMARYSVCGLYRSFYAVDGVVGGELTSWEFTAETEQLVAINSNNTYGDDYGYTITRKTDYSREVFLNRNNTPEYIDGMAYYGGDILEYKGGLFKARELTLKTPDDTYSWDSVGGGTGRISGKIIKIAIPNSMPIVDLKGILADDSTSERRPTRMELSLIDESEVKLNCLVDISVQGTSSAAHPKKGYAIDLLDFDLKDFKIQFTGGEFMGDPVTWTANDGFHLKAFFQDELMTRDVGGMRLWRLFFLDMPFPSNWFSVNGGNLPDDASSKKEIYEDRSRFITDGFPIELRVNGIFHGVYVWRQKKDRDNYRIIKDNKKHIWLEAAGQTKMDEFRPKDWELRNPKLPGYDEGDPIDDPEVMADINRLYGWMIGCFDGSIDFKDTYEDYLDINTFLYYIVFTELTYGTDGLIKNFHLMTYGDGVWRVNPYDLDLTLGYEFSSVNINPTSRALTKYQNKLFNLVYSEMLPEIKALYSDLKTKGIIDMATIMNIYRDIPARIGPDKLQESFDLWGSVPYIRNGHRSSMQWIMTYFKNRIDYLDGLWL